MSRRHTIEFVNAMANDPAIAEGVRIVLRGRPATACEAELVAFAERHGWRIELAALHQQLAYIAARPTGTAEDLSDDDLGTLCGGLPRSLLSGPVRSALESGVGRAC